MYNDKVLKHFKNPHNQGQIKNASAIGVDGGAACGDVMKIYLKIKAKDKSKKSKQDIIEDIKFETLGCAAAIAVSSALTDMIKGKTIEDALKITKSDVVQDLGGLPAPKVHCSILGIDAFGKAVDDYLK